jgi:hypothetical protein
LRILCGAAPHAQPPRTHRKIRGTSRHRIGGPSIAAWPYLERRPSCSDKWRNRQLTHWQLSRDEGMKSKSPYAMEGKYCQEPTKRRISSSGWYQTDWPAAGPTEVGCSRLSLSKTAREITDDWLSLCISLPDARLCELPTIRESRYPRLSILAAANIEIIVLRCS